MNITEDYVSFETAKLLKGKGFDEAVNCFYFIDGTFSNNTFHTKNSYTRHYAAPTLQMAMKWLREVHQVYINIHERYSGNVDNDINYSFVIRHYTKPVNPDLYDDGEFISYEEACELAIKYCLEHLM